MQFFTSLLSLAATAMVANAASITFWPLDDATRTIYFTGNPDMAEIAPFQVVPGANHTVDLPDTYIGNFYAVQEGHDNFPGMLGEIAFAGFMGDVFFDVSAIVNPLDIDNVQQIWPVGTEGPVSGCNPFPCNNAYYHSDDVQTQSSHENALMVTLGRGHTGLAFLENQ